MGSAQRVSHPLHLVDRRRLLDGARRCGVLHTDRLRVQPDQSFGVAAWTAPIIFIVVTPLWMQGVFWRDRDLDQGRRSRPLERRIARSLERRLTSELVELLDPVEVSLFGSVARDDDGGDSDLDMRIVLDHYNTADAVDLKRQAQVSP